MRMLIRIIIATIAPYPLGEWFERWMAISEMPGRSVVTVAQFGAVGDGITDDTASIQAAIDYGADVVLFVGGTHRISKPLAVGKSIKIMGPGTLVNINPNQYMIFVWGMMGGVVEIYDMCFM